MRSPANAVARTRPLRRRLDNPTGYQKSGFAPTRRRSAKPETGSRCPEDLRIPAPVASGATLSGSCSDIPRSLASGTTGTKDRGSRRASPAPPVQQTGPQRPHSDRCPPPAPDQCVRTGARRTGPRSVRGAAPGTQPSEASESRPLRRAHTAFSAARHVGQVSRRAGWSWITLPGFAGSRICSVSVRTWSTQRAAPQTLQTATAATAIPCWTHSKQCIRPDPSVCGREGAHRAPPPRPGCPPRKTAATKRSSVLG